MKASLSSGVLAICLAVILGVFSVTDLDASSQEDTGYTYYLPIILIPSNVLLADDFSDPGSGWPVNDDGVVKWSYEDGEYEMLIREEKTWAGALAPVSNLIDYSVQAEMRRREGTESDCGLIFDFKDWSNFYFFVVDVGDQWYGVAKVVDGKPEVVIPLTNTEKILVDQAVNLLKVKRNGDRIDVFINDEHMDGVENAGFGGGLEIGLYMESDGDAPAVVRFDNFLAWLPDGQVQTDVDLGSELLPVPVKKSGEIGSRGDVPLFRGES